MDGGRGISRGFGSRRGEDACRRGDVPDRVGPGLVRKCYPQLVEKVFQLSLSWMLRLDDNEPWVVGSTVETSEDVSSYQVGLEAMDRYHRPVVERSVLVAGLQSQ